MAHILINKNVHDIPANIKDILEFRTVAPFENGGVTASSDGITLTFPNTHPGAKTYIYVELKRGAARFVFTSVELPENSATITRSLKHHEAQQNSQIYVLVVRHGLPNEAFLLHHPPKPLTQHKIPQPATSADKIGSIHMHVDGNKNVESAVAQHLQSADKTWKVTNVMGAISGPQRDIDEFKSTYQAHTPHSPDVEGEEEFEQYMTIQTDEDTVVNTLQTLLNLAAPYKGFVIEAEQIIGKIDKEGNARWLNSPETHILEHAPITYKRTPTHPYEVHFIIEISSHSSNELPIELNKLMEKCTLQGMKMGGWFYSAKPSSGATSRWCYRSNHFENEINRDSILKQWTDLHKLMKSLGNIQIVDYSITCTIERVLGVWNTSSEHLVQIYQKITSNLTTENTTQQNNYILPPVLQTGRPNISYHEEVFVRECPNT